MAGNHIKVAIKMTTLLTKRHLLEAIGSVVPPHEAAYVAGPLATGQRYYELLASGDSEAASRVRQENEVAMGRFVSTLRTKLSYPVIDSGVMKIENWAAREIGELYLKIISSFAKEIWFMDGWEYSRGATKEFQFGVANGVSTLNSSGKTLSAEQGCRLIKAAAARLMALGIDATRFVDRIDQIRKVRDR